MFKFNSLLSLGCFLCRKCLQICVWFVKNSYKASSKGSVSCSTYNDCSYVRFLEQVHVVRWYPQSKSLKTCKQLHCRCCRKYRAALHAHSSLQFMHAYAKYVSTLTMCMQKRGTVLQRQEKNQLKMKQVKSKNSTHSPPTSPCLPLPFAVH